MGGLIEEGYGDADYAAPVFFGGGNFDLAVMTFDDFAGDG